ncbi:MAG: hypothetical protein PF450_06220 [Bacteroidales bacterium]|jgi:hypothetical protein|nr:hypothetical protein [Bacteroidales bacterium]
MNILDFIRTTNPDSKFHQGNGEDLYTTAPEQVYQPSHTTDIDEALERLTNPHLYSSSTQQTFPSFAAEEAPLYAAKASKPKCLSRRKPTAKPATSPPTPKYNKDTPFNPDDFIGGPYHDAAYFIKLFKPFTRRYLKRINFAGKSQWLFQHSPLSIKRIQSTITKGHEISWLSSFRTPTLGIDIDFHHLPYNCWDGYEPNPHLLDLYHEITRAFAYWPSLLCKSPNGLHIYYLLKKPIEYKNLLLLSKDKLSDITSTIEIKPSPKTGIRIPVQKWILDPQSFDPIGTENTIKWESIVQFETEELFGSDYRQKLRRLNFTKSDTTDHTDTPSNSDSTDRLVSTEEPDQLSRKEKYKRVLKAKRELLPFTNGQSNEILQQLIPKYRALFSIQSVIKLLINHINNSPGYTNELTDPYILERRVIDFFNSHNDDFIPASPKITVLPEHIEEIISKHTLVKQRTKGIKQYLLGLLNWKVLHDQSLSDYKFRSRMDDMYPYYSRNRKMGFYPLPSKVQKVWNKNYNSLLPWLKEQGILIDSGFKYSPGAHICKYYQIHL